MRLNIANNLGKTSKEIKVYVDAILPSLSSFSTEVLIRAIDDFSRSSKWWPKLAELIEGARITAQAMEYERQRKIAKLPPPAELTDRQRLKNLVAIKKLRQRLAQQRRMS